LVVVRILDEAESQFPFAGATKFRSLEGNLVVETDAGLAREGYLAELARHTESVREQLAQRGGRLLSIETNESPVETVRSIVQLVGAARR
jgi:uncharacterized protein (DUF58 family)